MASSSGVWGIEVGQTALKALHCSIQNGEVVADAFDYIEYPKILSQPESDPAGLISEALAQLLERNEAINDKVCISVPGQSGLAKFFKPPPVEVKKIADIVRYEAKQQIPFDLNDVVWDYQMMPGSVIEDNYAQESEIGLFAMKRQQVFAQLEPFNQANIEVDLIQMSPVALYNMVAYDRMHERVENETYDPDHPPPSSVLLSIGTDSSDLIITNGFRIWQRSMPIGGNHFTRQLTKDLKLTFAKAEHLKRNAREAVDPKLVFQTMRPVFNDLVTEVQRSIGFFRSLDKKAQISELLITGNTVKMPGLAAYLGKNLGYEVHVLDRFARLTGDDVLAVPTFRDNATTIAVCYGLCLQGLGLSQIHANLVPGEILTERLIRSKKPWTLAALAALLLGMTVHYWMTERSWASTSEEIWEQPVRAINAMESYHDEQVEQDDDLQAQLTYLNGLGVEVSGNTERRLKWLEILKVINELIPRPDSGDLAPGESVSPKIPYSERKDIHVTRIDSKRVDDLSQWWTETVKQHYAKEVGIWNELMGRKPGATSADDAPAAEEADGSADEYADDSTSTDDSALTGADTGPTGPGWVFEISGFHYFNDNTKYKMSSQENHVRMSMMTSFFESIIKLPVDRDPQGNELFEEFTPREMGLGYPMMVTFGLRTETLPLPELADQEPSAEPVATNLDDTEIKKPTTMDVQRLDFTFQFVWQEKLLSDRLAAKEEARKAAEAEATATEGDDFAATQP
jgi:type IV pilus assembly protein PilM